MYVVQNELKVQKTKPKKFVVSKWANKPTVRRCNVHAKVDQLSRQQNNRNDLQTQRLNNRAYKRPNNRATKRPFKRPTDRPNTRPYNLANNRVTLYRSTKYSYVKNICVWMFVCVWVFMSVYTYIYIYIPEYLLYFALWQFENADQVRGR